MCWLPCNLEATTSWNAQGLSRPVMRLHLPFIVMYLCKKCHGSKFHCFLEQHFITWFLHNTQLSSSIKQSPSSETNMSSPSQETPHILWRSTAFARACDKPYPEPYQSNPFPPPTSWRSILMFSSSLCPSLPSGHFSSGFPAKTVYAPLVSPIHAPCILFFLIWSPE